MKWKQHKEIINPKEVKLIWMDLEKEDLKRPVVTFFENKILKYISKLKHDLSIFIN